MTMVSSKLTEEHVFTSGIEGPACDRDGNLYAVNYAKQGTIGKITPDGSGELWLELPEGSIGNGIRFNREGDMFIADYTGHNILRVHMESKAVSVFAHEPRMNQPNDICILRDGTIFASDPNWGNGTGNLWRIDPSGEVTLMEQDMGTTNGVEIGPQEDVLYVNESAQRRIWVYDLSENKEISNKRLLIAFDDYSLDGMRCDMDGNLYVTRHGKGVVAKLSPQGELLQEIGLEGTDCTNLCFGGPGGKQCYVTVADKGGVQTFAIDRPGRCWGMWNG